MSAALLVCGGRLGVSGRRSRVGRLVVRMRVRKAALLAAVMPHGFVSGCAGGCAVYTYGQVSLTGCWYFCVGEGTLGAAHAGRFGIVLRGAAVGRMRVLRECPAVGRACCWVIDLVLQVRDCRGATYLVDLSLQHPMLCACGCGRLACVDCRGRCGRLGDAWDVTVVAVICGIPVRGMEEAVLPPTPSLYTIPCLFARI